LHSLQHRGQESCGIVSYDGKNYFSERRLGLVGDNFTKETTIEKLPGNFAIGHNRYSTTGAPVLRNIQPFFADLYTGGISIAHNGNLTNSIMLREKMIKDGAIFQTTSDTENNRRFVSNTRWLCPCYVNK
jgi:amidophosphoribosyltransferase